MSIPNTSTLIQRINKGSEGGNEFSRFINMVLTSEYKDCNVDFFVFSDAFYMKIKKSINNYFQMLINEMYFLADGGSFWDADTGSFGLLEC